MTRLPDPTDITIWYIADVGLELCLGLKFVYLPANSVLLQNAIDGEEGTVLVLSAARMYCCNRQSHSVLAKRMLGAKVGLHQS